jgi:predicted nucleic acid-binding protein
MSVHQCPNVFANSVLLSVRTSTLNVFRKADKSQVTTDADKEWINVTVRILESPELARIKSIDTQVSNYLKGAKDKDKDKNGISIPYFKFREGDYLISLQMLDEVEEKLNEFYKARVELVEKFIEAYEEEVKKSREKLNSLWDGKFYPTPKQVRKKFSMVWDTLVIGVPEEIKNISVCLYNKLQQRMMERVEEAYEIIVLNMRKEAISHIKSLISRLSHNPKDGKRKPALKDATFKILREYLDSFAARNVANDQELNEAIEICRTSLAGHSAEEIRDNDALKTSIKSDFDRALSVVQSMLDDDIDIDLNEDIDESESLNLMVA